MARSRGKKTPYVRWIARAMPVLAIGAAVWAYLADAYVACGAFAVIALLTWELLFVFPSAPQGGDHMLRNPDRAEGRSKKPGG